MLFILVIEIAHRRTYIQNDFGISLGLVLSANGFVIWNLSWTRWCPCFMYLWLLSDRKFISWFLSVVWSNCMLRLLVQIKKSTGEVSRVTYAVESVQDVLIKLGMKPCMHLVEISIFSLNLVIVRLTKIINRADKNWAQF